MELPVLDLAPFVHDRPCAAAEAFVDQLRAACHGPGFFYLTGHDVPVDLLDDVLRVSRSFFDLPLADKLAIENVRSPQFRGYTRVGHERTDGRPDIREQLDLGDERAVRPLQPGDPAYLRLDGPNQWPVALPELRSVLLRFMTVMEDVALAVVRAIAASLGQADDHFDATFATDAHSHAKVIRYPPPTGDHARSTQGVGAHKDYGYLALLLQDDLGGLQVASRNGGLVDAPPLPGTFVVNVGEMFEVATSGYYRATVHRVVSPEPGRDRISVPFFFAPRLDARVDPVPLPPALQADVVDEPPDPGNPIVAEYGVNALRGWVRSHPEVARRHYADVLEPAAR